MILKASRSSSYYTIKKYLGSQNKDDFCVINENLVIEVVKILHVTENGRLWVNYFPKGGDKLMDREIDDKYVIGVIDSDSYLVECNNFDVIKI